MKLKTHDLNWIIYRKGFVFQDVMGSGNLKQAITDLRQLLNAPIKHYTPDGATTVSSSSSSSIPSSSSSCSAAGPGKDDGVRNSYGSSHGQESFSADGGSHVAGPSYDHQMSATSEADSITEGDIPGQMTRVLGKSKSCLSNVWGTSLHKRKRAA